MWYLIRKDQVQYLEFLLTHGKHLKINRQVVSLKFKLINEPNVYSIFGEFFQNDLNYINYLPTRDPVRIEILSAAENVPLLNRDLDLIVKDASKYCEYSGYLDEDGITRIRIECTISEEEKEYIWDLLRFKHGRHSSISSEPSMLYR